MKLRAFSSVSCLLLSVASAAFAQLPPLTADTGPAPPVTPVEWKWKRFDKDAYLYLSAVKGGPLVLSVPAAPGEGGSGFNEYLDRYLKDEGYALGVLNWRGDFSRTALPSAIVSRAFSDLAQIRSKPEGFDSERIVFFGWGEGSFLALLLASDSIRLQASGIPRASACAVVLGHPMSLNLADTGSYLAKRQFEAEPGATKLSPLSFAASGPPVMIISKMGDRDDEARSAFAAAALRAAGRIVVQTTYPQLDERNPRTFFGWHENAATQKLGEFLKTYCPAKRN